MLVLEVSYGDSTTACRYVRVHTSTSHTSSVNPIPYKMSKVQTPELKKYMDKRLFVQLNGTRKVVGVLRGYDVFLNIVLDDAVEETSDGGKINIGQVVIRGNSVVMMEVCRNGFGAYLDDACQKIEAAIGDLVSVQWVVTVMEEGECEHRAINNAF
ncbi:hypothetical protein G7K_5347-t1 [Saitoella complicata NRRL Y-17804]|uniref:Small nuclear ribonucleoprotein G n=1 Tax=Saitoella complicata (strain BCRC 22490 / CBS 7301 / JCM 7358 / NBRC 10748 / NRRL Y-17804) TaxID=698492 RepID=A0A0E9NN28_SAICN|nr:hypothetical protein G7K_5347-t1 [Saitoella complicata NRRL Y-17804]